VLPTNGLPSELGGSI